jgi:hypothetical protein
MSQIMLEYKSFPNTNTDGIEPLRFDARAVHRVCFLAKGLRPRVDKSTLSAGQMQGSYEE